MGVYTSTHTGADIDNAVTRALPTGILSTGKQNTITTEGILKGEGDGTISAATVDSTPTSGSSNLVSSGGVYTAISEKATVFDTTCTLPTTGWTVGTYWCANSVTVSGILYNDKPILDVAVSGANYEAELEVWNTIVKATAYTGSITFYTTEIPSTEITINIKVVR